MTNNYECKYKKQLEEYNTVYKFSEVNNVEAIKTSIEQITKYDAGEVKLESLKNITTGEEILRNLNL